jgi:hypothetical protein
MHRERVGEIRRSRVFEATALKISAETCADAKFKRNSVAIYVFIPGFSDVP